MTQMLDSPSMSGSEGLGFGTQISLTGVYAGADKLGDAQVAHAVLERIVREAEPDSSEDATSSIVTYDSGADGLSAILVKGETVATLHAFPTLRTATLCLFSAHDISLSNTTRTFLEAYSVGRFESSVRAFGLYPRRDPQALTQALAGERAYARLRIAPLAAVTT